MPWAPLDPVTVTTVLPQGDVKQTVLKVADEINPT